MNPIEKEQFNQNRVSSSEGEEGDIVVRNVKDFVQDMQKTKQVKRRSAKSYFDRPDGKLVTKPKDKPKAERIVKKVKPAKVKTAKVKPAKIKPAKTEAFKIIKKNTKPLEFVDDYPLPESYDLTYVTLVARDPHWIYAYWELDHNAIERARSFFGDAFHAAAYTLRLYDVTLVDFNGYNANRFDDYDELFMKNRYINITNDAAAFCAEIGMRAQDGRFFAFSRSNVTSTQREGQSNQTELIWKKVDGLDKQEAFINIDIHKKKIKEKPLNKSNWQFHLKKVPLSTSDINSFYQRKNGSNGIIKQEIIERLRKKLSLTSDEEIIFEDSSVTILSANQPGYKKIYRGSSEILVKEYSGASEGLFVRDVKKAKSAKKEFPFQLEMELIVRGKTIPGAKVFHGQKQIALRNDGSFELKYSLQDGVLPMEFRAFSESEGLGKTIDTSVIRTQTRENDYEI